MKRVSNEQSVGNFEVYKADIEKVAYNYGYVLIEADDVDSYWQDEYACDCEIESCIMNDDDFMVYTKEYAIEIDDGSIIEIWLQNWNHYEEFSIEYSTEISHMEDMNKTVPVTFFVELINAVSGRQITEEYCNKFLNADEEDYSPQRYGFEKGVHALVYKFDFLNFFEDWAIEYELTNHYEERLSFWGLCKQH